MIDAAAVSTLILDAVAKSAPFNFIRLGDGEGLLLSGTDTMDAADLAYWRGTLGEGATISEIAALRNLLDLSARCADLLGLRTDVWNPPQSVATIHEDRPDFFDRFMREFPLRSVDRHLDRHGAHRIFGLYQWAQRQSRSANSITSSWVAYDLALRGFWDHLLEKVPAVTLIHCSQTLPDVISSRFNLVVEHIAVPDRPVDALGALPHFPKVHDEIVRHLSIPHRGRLHLVGAGIPGKHYLHVIRENGGIGLDLGALLDAWDGRSTRPLVYRDKLGDDVDTLTAPVTFQLRGSRI